MREAFSVADELTCYYDRAAEPANVHVEARVAGHLDQAVLRAAVRAVLAAEPGLLVRRAGTGWSRHFFWERAVTPADDPVTVESYGDEGELAGLRSAAISRSPGLDDPPPLNLLLAVGPPGDVLLLNAHHARFDGLASLRLLQAVAAEYTRLGGGEPAPTLPGRSASAEARPAGTAALPVPARAGRGRVARIAAAPEAGCSAGATDGYGLHQLSWDGLAPGSGRRGAGRTVNDLLIAAMIDAISGWNAAHGARRADLVKITMPVGDRAQLSSSGEWANRSRLTSVTARAGGWETGEQLLTEVAAQTRYAKEHPGPQVGFVSRAVARAPVPTGIKRLVVRAAVVGAGNFLADSSLVSNLGVIEPLAFGGAQAESVWFSTSAHMPRGLSLGAVSCGDGLRLTFRYRRALLTDAAAARFADRYLEALDRLAGRRSVPAGGAR